MCALAYARAQKLPLFSGTDSRTLRQDIYLYTDNSLFVISIGIDIFRKGQVGNPLRRFQDVSLSLLFQILYLFYSCCLLSLRDFIFCIQNPDIESYMDKSATTWLLLGGRSLRSLSSYLFILFFMVILSPFFFFFFLSYLYVLLYLLLLLFYSLVCARQVRTKSAFWIQEKRSVGQPKRGVLDNLGYSLR